MTYQLPGIAQEGLTIVCTPTYSLLQDQVLALVSKDVPAYIYSSGLIADTKVMIIQELKFGTCKFLYVSPEVLLSAEDPLRTALLSILPNDEACTSSFEPCMRFTACCSHARYA